MIRAKTEELKHIPWFAKAGAACSIIPISRFVGPNIFALKGGGYWPFDLLSFDGNDITHRSATYRLQLLIAMLKARPSKAIGRVRTAFSEREKYALLNTIRAERGEGVVFKNAHARYSPGRPASGGDALKHKFKASATCAVLSHSSGKLSVQIAVSNDAANALPLR